MRQKRNGLELELELELEIEIELELEGWTSTLKREITQILAFDVSILLFSRK